MKILLDTHYLIWIISDPDKIKKSIKKIISNNEIFASSINFWEISLKSSIGKLKLNNISINELYQATKQSNINIIDLTSTETSSFNKLPLTEHKNPFDRMLIWQAISNDFLLLTDDKLIKKYYPEFGLSIIGK